MKNIKLTCILVAILVACGVGFVLFDNFCGKNDVQNFQIIQSLSGDVRIQSKGGFYGKFFANVWTYPKTDSVFFSNQTAESKDNDGIEVRFSNKGTGVVSCQVVYRLFSEDVKMKKLHEYCGGDLDKLDNIVLAKIKEHAGNECAKKDSSSAIEQREQLAADIRKKLIEDADLKDKGIDIETFVITAIKFDKVTEDLFAAQRQADLQKRTFQAEEEKLQMEKKKTIAQAEQEIAAAKGKAEVEKMTQVTQAEKEKELAQIESQKKVEIEKLAKEEAIVKAQKQVELAELTKKEETIKLETIKIQAEQKIAEAKAKEQQIALAGNITEKEKFMLEITRDTKIGVAKAFGDAIRGVNLPKVFIMGNGSKGENNTIGSFDMLMQLMVAEKADNVVKGETVTTK